MSDQDNIDDAGDAEIKRRMEKIRRGEATFVSWEEARRRIRESLEPSAMEKLIEVGEKDVKEGRLNDGPTFFVKLKAHSDARRKSR